MLKLTDLVNRDAHTAGVWVTYKDTSFRVRITYYGKAKMQELFDRCKKSEFDIRTLTDKEELDREAFRREYARAVVKGWEGLTAEVLAKLLVVDAEKLSEVPAGHEFECTPEYAEFLVQNSIEFDQWLQRACTSLETFNSRKKEDELKNSSATPAGSV